MTGMTMRSMTMTGMTMRSMTMTGMTMTGTMMTGTMMTGTTMTSMTMTGMMMTGTTMTSMMMTGTTMTGMMMTGTMTIGMTTTGTTIMTGIRTEPAFTPNNKFAETKATLFLFPFTFYLTRPKLHTSGTMKTMIAAAAFTGLVSAHSWVHCTDYRGDTTHFEADKCFGNPRPLDGKVPGMTPFGQDTGFNQQPGSTLCHSTESTHASYPMATYQRGQQITLAWPTKNHVAAECTNSFIPDTALELFVAPFTTTTETNYEWSQVSASFSEDPHVNGQMDFKGFQNCPDFCNNMDKALCTGTFILPDSFADGLYTFQWRWEFNAGSPSYITCFESEVKGDFDGTIITPTPRPTVAGQTPEPTAQPENCGSEWSQCGGAGPSYSCCNSGLTCFRK